MTRIARVFLFALPLILLGLPSGAAASDVQAPDAEVRLPLSDYGALIAALGGKSDDGEFVLGPARVQVQVSGDPARPAADVAISLEVTSFAEKGTLVPLLPAGLTVTHASRDGRPMALKQVPGGLAWRAPAAGQYRLQLAYRLDARSAEGAVSLPLSLPRASRMLLDLSLPGTGLDVALAPASNLRIREEEGRTRVLAELPAVSQALVSWRGLGTAPFAISRADYSGEAFENSIRWQATFQVELFTDQTVTLPVMPAAVTLQEVSLDGNSASTFLQEGDFAMRIKGRGRHEIELAFVTPLRKSAGQQAAAPQASLAIPRIPISHFELRLPGRKDLEVSPGSGVATTFSGDTTLASVFVPMTSELHFTWRNAVPDKGPGRQRANASLYHGFHAEEGVLHGRAAVVYEITHGEISRLLLEVPETAQINRVSAPDGGISDWLVGPAQEPGFKTLEVFLETARSGEFQLDISYERLLGSDDRNAPLTVPLFSAREVHRQRGMVALLAGPDLTLEPVEDKDLSRVGENQLPAFLRQQISMTLAHTYKYIDPRPALIVKPVAPERRQGIFDAQVDTLLSLGEVAMKGNAGIEIDVKSGSIVDLDLKLPRGVNVLSVTAPSLRSHSVADDAEDAASQVIALAFTREMSGLFRVDVAYERIMDAGAAETEVPGITVPGAQVEHGRLAVEALTAVEVQATRAARLSTLDLNELPQQLLLKTTNPILLAYRYAQADPPFDLALKITRHREIDVQLAAIEEARYRTLMVRDGLAVTSAKLLVRNSRRQFLRLDLPEGTEVWSVFVDGKAEKPAFAGDPPAQPDAKAQTSILIKMINSAKGFPVEIVYATPLAAMADFGTLSSRLPRPDMVVTRTAWDLFLPEGPRYLTPDSTLDVIVPGRLVNPRQAAAADFAMAQEAYHSRMGEPLRLTVPVRGIQYSFEKLYASQSPEPAKVEIRYLAAEAHLAGLLFSALGVILLWAGILFLARDDLRARLGIGRTLSRSLVPAGLLLLLATLGYLETPPHLAATLALAIAFALALGYLAARFLTWRRSSRPVPGHG